MDHDELETSTEHLSPYHIDKCANDKPFPKTNLTP